MSSEYCAGAYVTTAPECCQMCLPGYAAVLCDTVIVPGNQSDKLRLFTGSRPPVNPADNSTQDHRILLPPHVGLVKAAVLLHSTHVRVIEHHGDRTRLCANC